MDIVLPHLKYLLKDNSCERGGSHSGEQAARSTLVLEYDKLLVLSSVHVHAEPPSMLAPRSSTESSVLAEVYVEESSQEQIPADPCRSTVVASQEAL